MAAKHQNLWHAVTAAYQTKFGLFRSATDAKNAGDISKPVGWFDQWDDASGTAQNVIGTNATTGVTEFKNTKGNTFTTPLIGGAAHLAQSVVQTSANTTGLTWSTANMLNLLLIRTGTNAGISDVSATAAALVAALPGVAVNTSFTLAIRNDSSNTITVTAGTGVTLATNNTNTIAAGSTRTFRFVFTNVTAASEAITAYSLGTVVH